MLASALSAASSAESSLSNGTCVAVAGGLLAACGFITWKWNQERRERLAVEHQLAETHKAQAESKNRERALKETHSARRDELQGLKHEVGAQRKKNHVLQEDLKKARDELREETRLRIAAQNTRPAFADVDPKPKVEAKPEPVAPPPPPPPIVVDAQQEAKLRHLQSDLEAARVALHTEREAIAAHKDELKKLRRRAEDLRRIDIITKSKMELLEDKLRGLGRQYYEAISELAAARGEVVPPRPRDLPPEPPADRSAEAEALAEANCDVDTADRSFDDDENAKSAAAMGATH
jgi:chromosome segregation ATPase